MLGIQLVWPSDAFFSCFWEGLLRDAWGDTDLFVADEVFCCRVQVGDGSTTQRYTPVSVSGLGSGVAMIALGWVRFVAIALGRFDVLERSVCI